MQEQLYNIIRIFANKGDNVPDYLLGITLNEIYNYFFNWHPHEEMATLEEVRKWFLEARGWAWEPVKA